MKKTLNPKEKIQKRKKIQEIENLEKIISSQLQKIEILKLEESTRFSIHIPSQRQITYVIPQKQIALAEIENELKIALSLIEKLKK